jgi:hypothetical protein
MSVTVASKIAKFEHFTLHQLNFKAIDAGDFVELYDAVNDYLYQNQACIISSFLTGNTNSAKTITKASKKVFDEVNWPLNWIGSFKESKHSGCFLAISGVNVFTIVGADFITKIIETPQARFAFVGGIFTDAVESKQQIKELESRKGKAFEMAGLISKNTVRSWYFSKCNTNFHKDLNQNETSSQQPSLNTIVEGSILKHNIQTYFFALQAKTDAIQIVKGMNESDKLGSVLISCADAIVLMVSSLSELLNRVEKPNEHEIEHTLDAVEALILSHNLGWNNLWRAVAYFKNSEEMTIFKTICKGKGIPMAPLLMVVTEFNEKNTHFLFEADFVLSHAE